ncbi:PREDICTED: uncharacterized protein LOC104815709 isoform X2 [Tarenaya hassleriana]|uniref:uncharacterized protein LOC104815709 isoform X2 n=1 Tax=Tarenaya hassleriana TaxID=28532 RepID=UPI00053C60EC|nr:PREDICTED: uncharacterized protein LOC104815709 isoform X2 [Tarenaya hassleriana]
MSKATAAMKVAVIGSGISGAVCASTLARNGVSVTLFESARGPGGRMSQRREISEDGKDLLFDHGAPFFTVSSNSDALTLVHDWESRGVVSEWTPTFGSFDCTSNKFLGPQQQCVQEGSEKKYVGVPGMNSICRTLCHDPGVESKFGTGIAKLEWMEEETSWSLEDSNGENLGSFCGVVASDKSIASPRFTDLTGRPPPLNLNLIPELANRLQDIPVRPCFALMLAFKEPLSLIPTSCISFKNSEILSWAHCDSSKPSRSTESERWILHSTPEYANRVVELTGRRKPSNETLNKVSERMFQEFQSSGLVSSQPFFMKAHRWGSAFPVISIAMEERCLWDRKRRLAICGDFCISPNVEGAILSGLAAASKLSEISSCL